jgi:NADH-quinone oxidoreductase subunit C
MNPIQSSITYLAEPPGGMPGAVLAALRPFQAQWSEHHGCHAVLVGHDDFFPAAKALKEEAGFDFFVDHTAVDYPGREPRFTVVAVLLNMQTQLRLILKTRTAEGEPVASLTPLWEAANWAERETYDMFGIEFAGHPDLTRIYMPQNYEGFPLRRDFPLQGHLRFRD